MKTRIALLALVAGSMAGVASAQANGSYVFTSDSDNVYHLPTGAASPNVVAAFPAASRLLGIAVGPSNRLYVGNGPFPVQQPVNSTTMVYTVDNWFGGPAAINNLQNGDPIQNPNHFTYHGPYGGLVTVNNPGTQTPLPNRSEGIYHVNGTTGATTLMYAEPGPVNPLPYYNAGGAVIARQGVANQFFVTAVEGSPTQSLGHSSRASSLHRLDVNPGTLAATETLVIDLGNTAQTGLAFPVSRADGIASVGNSLYLTSYEFSTDISRIIKVDLTPGGAVAGVSVLVDNLPFMNDIVYNPYNGKLAMTDRSVNPGIWEVNLDGSGLTKILNDGTLPQRLAVIPAPGALALLGVGTLVAARRRR